MRILEDTEHRIFLSAMTREEKVCTHIDDEEFGGIKLLPICKSIKRKVNEAIPREAIEEILKESYEALAKAETNNGGCQEIVEIIESIHKHTGVSL